MGSKHRSIQAKASDKDSSLTFNEHETDSPVIPIAQLERLQAFKPEAVDWLIKQTEVEADFRRSESRRVNKFLFIEHIIGQIFGFIIGALGIGSGVYLVSTSSAWAGTVISATSVTGLAAVFIVGRKSKKPN